MLSNNVCNTRGGIGTPIIIYFINTYPKYVSDNIITYLRNTTIIIIFFFSTIKYIN